MKNKGFSLIELLIVVAIILIIAAIAIPNLLRSRIMANQASAVSTLRNINNSEAAYLATYGSIGYADTLQKLGPGNPCSSNGACMIDEVLACATAPCLKSNYGYFLTSDSTAAPFTDYATTATPVTMGSSGQFNYCSADDGILRQETTPTKTLTSALTRTVCTAGGGYVPIQ